MYNNQGGAYNNFVNQFANYGMNQFINNNYSQGYNRYNNKYSQGFGQYNNNYSQGFNQYNNNYIQGTCGYNNNYTQEFNEYNNYPNNNNNDTKEIDLKLKELFSKESMGKLKSRNEIINYFFQKEKECIEYINTKFKGNEDLRKYLNEQLYFIFYHNNYFFDEAQKIYYELDKINLDNFLFENEYFQELENIFGKVQFPSFLIEYYLDNLRHFISNKQKNIEVSIIFKKGKIEDSKFLIEMYERIRDVKHPPFENIPCKYEIFNLFIYVNYDYLMKPYFKDILINFLLPNLSQVEQINCNIDQIINENQNYLGIIDNHIKGDKYKIFNIIASLYVTLIYIFKDKSSYKNNNIDNVYINLIIKNFVIFLNENYYNKLNLNSNLFDLLKELYKEDIKYLMNQKMIPYLKNYYTFPEIEKILTINENFINYDNLKKSFSKFSNKKETFGIIRNAWRNICGYQIELNKYIEYLSLVRYEYSNIYSNTITLLIDGYTTQNKDPKVQWETLINIIKDDTIIYFYKWPSGYLFSCNHLYQFQNSTGRAKYCGKLLAHILLSKQIFDGYQINLVGFSLGNHVIKHCLKELKKYENINIKLKKVILIAGATQISNKEIWKNIIEKIVVDKFVNCYSKNDTILGGAYKKATGKQNPIGLNELIINNDNGKNLVWNYEFLFDHIYYDYGVVANSIFKYKDI